MRSYTATPVSPGLVIGPCRLILRREAALHAVLQTPAAEQHLFDAARILAQGELLAMLPEELRAVMTPALYAADLTAQEKKLLKAADRLSAVIKCVIEAGSGNGEFASAYDQQMEALHAMECPEAEWFITTMLPAYTRTLDELTRPD